MTSPSTAAQELLLPTPNLKRDGKVDKSDTLTLSTTSTSASAALARSLFLFLGLMFRRPSKLFRPSRVDTWGGLRHLALQADQSLSPAFIRSLIRSKSGTIAVGLTILPPLVINTTLGFLLFTSHSFFALTIARLPFFRHPHHESVDSLKATSDDDSDEEEISLHTLLSGPTVIPAHPTLLSAISGGLAGLVQGVAFTPIENVVRLLQQSATSLTSLLIRTLRLPLPNIPSAEPIPANPIIAIRNFLSSETWRKSRSWWSGWRWTVARDALSYSVFFAVFDVTRRVGLRVKAFFGGPTSASYHDILSFTVPDSPAAKRQEADRQATPTIARVAQAITIVAGGVSASLAAEYAGRPFRTCQRIIQAAKATPGPRIPLAQHPVLELYRARGFRPFLRPDEPLQTSPELLQQSRLQRGLKRVGWRLAAVGPWGFGFLVWAWVGGEV